MGAVAHHQPASALVALADELGDVGIDLGLQGLGQHPTGALTDEFVDQHRPIGAVGVIGVGSSRNYGEHGSYLPDRRWRADLARGLAGDREGTTPLAHPRVSSIAPAG